MEWRNCPPISPWPLRSPGTDPKRIIPAGRKICGFWLPSPDAQAQMLRQLTDENFSVYCSLRTRVTGRRDIQAREAHPRAHAC